MAKTVYLLDKGGNIISYSGINKILVPTNDNGVTSPFFSEELMYKPKSVATIPTASEEYLDKIILYNGTYYICELVNNEYIWNMITTLDDSNANEKDLVVGKIAYSLNGKIIGNMQIYGGEYEDF